MSYTNKPIEIRHSQAALRVEGYAVPRVQSLGYTADLNAEEVFELGNATAVEIVNADPTVSLTIDMHDIGSIDFLNQISTSYIGQVDNTNDNTDDGGFIPHTEFETSVTDFNVVVRESPTGTATRVAWFGNCTLDSISGSYQVDGFATESFSFSGANQVWFLGSLNTMCVIPMVRADNTTLNPVTGGFEGDFTCITTTPKLYADGVLVDSTEYTLATTGIVSAVGGYVFNAGVRYRVIARISSPAAFPESYLTESDIGGLKEREVELVMWDGTTVPAFGEDSGTTDTLLRIQSVDYELSLDREELRQLFTGLYSRTVNETSISSTITALDSDLQLWAYGVGERDEWIADSGVSNEYSLSNFQEMSDLKIRIALFRSPAARTAGDVLKYILLEGGKVTSVGDSFDVPGRGTVTMEISFSSLTYVGTGEVGRTA